MLRNLAAGFYNISLIHSMYLYAWNYKLYKILNIVRSFTFVSLHLTHVWAFVSVYMCMCEHV